VFKRCGPFNTFLDKQQGGIKRGQIPAKPILPGIVPVEISLPGRPETIYQKTGKAQ
jgi:hypothetical protein